MLKPFNRMLPGLVGLPALLAPAAAQSQPYQDDIGGLIGAASVFLTLIGILVAASLPTIIAFKREHPNRWLILVVNLGLGATIVGWLAALVWALNKAHLPQNSSDSPGGQSGLNLFVNDTKRVELINSASTSSDALVMQLGSLDRLRADGAITAEEHAQLRLKVLRQALAIEE